MTFIASKRRLNLAVLAEPPSRGAWLDALRTLAAWPLPETLLVERRLVRRGRRLEERLLASTDGDAVLADVDASLSALLRPLRKGCAMRDAPAPLRVRARTFAILDGVGCRPQAYPDGMLADAVDDLGVLPEGAGLGLVVWRQAPDPRGDETRELQLASPVPGYELRLAGVTDEPVRACLRLWSPTALPASLLARLAAATGADRDGWRVPRCAEAWAVAHRELEQVRRPADAPEPESAVSLERLAALLACPALSPPRRRRYGVPYPGRLAGRGAAVGRVLTPAGTLRTLRIPWEQRRRHLFVCGKTGSGKSELIARLAAEDLESGRGLLLLDPHGDLADHLLGHVPDKRADDVVLVEPQHPRTAAIPALPPGLSVHEQLAAVDDVFQDLFRWNGSTSRWRRPGGVALEAMNALPGVEPSLVGLDRIMEGEDVRIGLAACLRRGALANRMRASGNRIFWDRGTTHAAGLATSPGRAALDHAARWTLDEAVERGLIVIAKLDIGELGTLDAGRLGGALLRLAFGAITRLGSAARQDRPPLSIVVDEAHLFADSPVLGALLAQARKYGASLTLCTQAPTRLPRELLTDVLTHCGTALALQLPQREAAVFSDRHPAASAAIRTLPRYHAVTMLDDSADHEATIVLHPLRPLARHPDRRRATTERARHSHGRLEDGAHRADLERFATLADRFSELPPHDLFGHRPTDPRYNEHVDDCIEATLAGRALPPLPVEGGAMPGSTEEPERRNPMPGRFTMQPRPDGTMGGGRGRAR